jgi:hypothetical protein
MLRKRGEVSEIMIIVIVWIILMIVFGLEFNISGYPADQQVILLVTLLC